jgi:hypothetical protein
MTLQTFITHHPSFVWWTQNSTALSDASIIEATLNYGTWDDVQEMIRIAGIRPVARVFRAQSARARSNYHPKTKHFFALYFDAHAPRDS